MPPFAMKILGGLGVLTFAVVALILFGNSRYHSGQLAERAIWQAKTAAATLSDQKHASTVETAQTAVTQESTDDLKAKLVDALARAAARPRRVCYSAQTSGGVPNMPSAADAASGPPGASPAAVLDVADDEACAVNTVKAEGWLDWWTKEAAIPR